ncbi:hypothetical protein ACFXTH_001367 [Malus domestica]
MMKLLNLHFIFTFRLRYVSDIHARSQVEEPYVTHVSKLYSITTSRCEFEDILVFTCLVDGIAAASGITLLRVMVKITGSSISVMVASSGFILYYSITTRKFTMNKIRFARHELKYHHLCFF